MRIRRTTLQDGRYLIYYTFDAPGVGDDEATAAQAGRAAPRARAEASEEAGVSAAAEGADDDGGGDV